jgi:hypothetical protein
MRVRVRPLPVTIRLLLFVLVVWTVALTIALAQTEDFTGFIFIYGYYLGDRVTYDAWGPLYAAFLLGAVVLPFLNLAASLSIAEWSRVMILDRVFGGVGFVAAIGGALGLLLQAVDVIWVLLSPGFVLLPLATGVTLIIWKRRQRKRQNLPEDLELPLRQDAISQL